MLIDETRGEKYPGAAEGVPEAEVETIIRKLAELGKLLLRERHHETLDNLRATIDDHMLKHLSSNEDAVDWIPKSDKDRSDHHMWVIAERKERLQAARYRKEAEQPEKRLNELLLDKQVSVIPHEGVDPDNVFGGNFESVTPKEVIGEVTAITGVHGTITLETAEQQVVTACLLAPLGSEVKFQASVVFSD